jgi:hypothetical protein
MNGVLKHQKPSGELESFCIKMNDSGDYFSARKSLILSLCTMASLKVYAPVFGLLTDLITLVQFFASAAAFWSLVLIAVLAAFAMII